MALAQTLVDQSGTAWPMAGILPGTATMQQRLAGLGSQGYNTPSGVLRGHTFHYSVLDTTEQPSAQTFKHSTRANAGPGEAVYKKGSLTASYFHAYFASNPSAAAALFTGEQ